MNELRVRLQTSPRVRGIVLLVTLLAASLGNNPVILALLTAVGVAPVLTTQGILPRFLRTALVVVAPVAIGLILLWGIALGAPPNHPPASDPEAGYRYASVVIARLTLVIAVLHACFLSLTSSQLLLLLRSWGLRGELLMLLTAALALWPEFASRTEQIVAARCARGLMPDRRLLTRLRQIPFILRTLLTAAMGNAMARMDLWQQQNLLRRLEGCADPGRGPVTSGTIAGDALFLAGGFGALIWAFTMRFT